MSSTVSALKSLAIPAVISLILFLLSTYVLVPLWQRYRNRYNQYIPLDRISDQTSGLRGRLQTVLARWFIPSNWRFSRRDPFIMDDDVSDAGYSSDEGEELDVVPQDHRHAFSLDTRAEVADSSRRLSRDLEEGFRDDSDDSEDDRRNRP